MAEDRNANEWEMTKTERRELEDLSAQRSALLLMAEAQHVIAVRISEAEKRWWGKVFKRLGLDEYERPGFTANCKTGKVVRT